jgi:uncharacterized damage-inducible protein DinB
MTNKDALGRLLEYTEWANHRIVRASATLSVDDFKRDLGSSHGGVRGTLAHMLSTEWIWLERFKGVSPSRMLDEGEFPDVLALRERWGAVEAHRRAWFKSMKEQGIRDKIKYQNTKGRAFEAPLWQLLQHVANHATYHRGQVTTLLRILKAPVVSTDLLLWDREGRPRASRT